MHTSHAFVEILVERKRKKRHALAIEEIGNQQWIAREREGKRPVGTQISLPLSNGEPSALKCFWVGQ